MGAAIRALQLVRNGVDHDARVLRAARVGERTLGGSILVVGVATATAQAGSTTVEGVPVMRLPARLPRITYLAGRRVRRILGGVAFAFQAFAVARRTRPSLVHANDWNTMWCALAIKLAYGARVVYDSHELWADRNGRWEWRLWLLASEALFVRLADEVITPSPGYADALAARYRVAAPTVIRNIPEGPPHDSTAPARPPLAVYVGGLMPGRGLEQAIDALALMPTARLRAVGPGSESYRAGLVARARAIGVIDRLELVRPVAPGAVSTVMQHATAGLCLIQPVCRSYELTLPNKLFEYAAAGLPVLASDLPVIAGVVREAGLGEVVAPEDPSAIAAGLERLADPLRWRVAAGCAHTFARAQDWDAEARALGEVYTRALAEADR